MHFLGVKWDNHTKKPYIKYREIPNQGEEKYYPLEFAKNLCIKVLENKHCIGFDIPPDYIKSPCNNNEKLTDSNSHQCSGCRYRDSTYFMPVDYLSVQQITTLKKLRHYNYINLFGKDVIKVGVAADTRKFTRLLEQGAFATIIFGEGDGYTTRKIEDLVSKNLKIKQAINWICKIKLLKLKVSPEEAKAKLTSYYKDIVNIIDDDYNSHFRILNEFYYNADRYSVNIPSTVTEIRYLDHLEPTNIICGEVTGIFGEILILKTPDNKNVAFNTRSLLGYVIEVKHNFSLSTDFNYKQVILERPVNNNLTLF